MRRHRHSILEINCNIFYNFYFFHCRSPNPIMSLDVGERVYAADVDYPMAVVGTAGRGLCIYTLEGQPKEYKRVEPPLKYQHRCISIFKDKKAQPAGRAQHCTWILQFFSFFPFFLTYSFYTYYLTSLEKLQN